VPVLTHLAMHVADVAAVVDFYRDYCGMTVVHERGDDPEQGDGVVWLAEPGRETELVFVVIPGGPRREGGPHADYSHLGFARESRAAVDAIAARAEGEGRLQWPARDEPYPVGYFCGVRDPNGRAVEFSYGQPLGPGAPSGAS